MSGIKSKIWVFIEQRGGETAQVGRELTAKALEQAARPGWGVAAVILGRDIAALAEEAAAWGVAEVLTADHPLLADYCNESYTKVLAGAIRQAGPEVILIGATALGTDLAPRLAARLRTGLSAHCVDLEVTPAGELLAVVPGWGGSVMAKISCPQARPQMATVTPGVFEPVKAGSSRAELIDLAPELTEADLSYRVLDTVREKPAASALDQAEVVVAGGWGVGSKADWKLIEDLAAALNGTVGATRPPVDQGWVEESRMIGTSGRTISPKLYIGVALSANAHHTVGLKKVGLSVGINSDPKAPLFDFCDIGLIGDFKVIVPALINKLTG